MSDIEMHYRFERYWEENASKDTWANKSVAFNIWQSRQAEIDGLTIKLNGANERAMSLLNHKNRMVDKMQAEIDSLNKNIEALHVEIGRIQKEYQGMFEGVQGRQKTIDELQAKYDELNNRATCVALDQMTTAKLNYELQKRIDDLEKNKLCIQNLVKKLNIAESKLNKIAIQAQKKLETFGSALRFKDAVQDILKGNKDEN